MMQKNLTAGDDVDSRQNVSSSWGGVKAIIGGFLVHFILGVLYTWGNMSPYIASYSRNVCLQQYRHQDFLRVLASAASGQAIGMVLGGKLEPHAGPRLTALLGGFILSASIFVSSFVLCAFTWFTITYGLMFGIGMGIAYTSPISCALRWLPEKKGIVSGVITAGLGSSAIVFNQIQTRFINPSNISMVEEFLNERYFNDSDLLSRVPKLIMGSSAVYLVVTWMGALLLVNPPSVQPSKSSAPSPDSFGRQSISSLAAMGGVIDEPPKELAHVRLSAALFTPRFLLLFSSFFLNGLAVTFLSGMWKTAPGAANYNDRYLSIVGSVGSLGNAAGRIVWGSIADATSIYVSLILLTGVWTMLLIIWPIYASMPGFYFFIVSVNFSCLGGNYALFPAATAGAFGNSNLGAIYGCMFLSQLLAANFAATIIPSLTSGKLCYFFAGIVFCSFSAVVLYGKKINTKVRFELPIAADTTADEKSSLIERVA